MNMNMIRKAKAYGFASASASGLLISLFVFVLTFVAILVWAFWFEKNLHLLAIITAWIGSSGLLVLYFGLLDYYGKLKAKCKDNLEIFYRWRNVAWVAGLVIAIIVSSVLADIFCGTGFIDAFKSFMGSA